MASTSTTSSNTGAIYTASVNPPRRAKRVRTSLADDSDDEFDGPTSPAVRTILPKTAPGAAKPLTPSSSPKATRQPAGAQGGSLSRAQRESLRKQNHSRIEKARRTKINDALAELRILVPKDVAVPLDGEEEEDEEDPEDDADYVGGRKRGQTKPKAEKEFKLEVLVRTVAHLKTLVQRVSALEQQTVDPTSTCTCCSGAGPGEEDNAPSSKRRRLFSSSQTEDSDVDMDVDVPFSAHISRTITPTESLRPSPSPRLPPISSWLPLLPYAEPSSLAATPRSLAVTPRTQAAKYPSPPPSGSLPPRATAAPPALALPPARSATMSAERDSDAASLLLRLRAPGLTGPCVPQATFAQTPASLLGLGR